MSRSLKTAVSKNFDTTQDSRLPLTSFTMTGRRMFKYSITTLVGIGSTTE